jgi:hypothetical protein
MIYAVSSSAAAQPGPAPAAAVRKIRAAKMNAVIRFVLFLLFPQRRPGGPGRRYVRFRFSGAPQAPRSAHGTPTGFRFLFDHISKIT